MSTTTIRLDDDTKARVAKAADRAGQTSHAFIIDAITRTLEAAEQRDAFEQLAETRWARIAAGGETVAWEALKGSLQARAEAIAKAARKRR